MRLALCALLALPAAAAAQGDWPYTQNVTACFVTGDSACIGDAAAICMGKAEDGETTVGMMDCLLGEAQAWDDLLNAEYVTARDHARRLDAGDAVDFPQFAVRAGQVLAAQRAWIAYRDANCTMAYGLAGAGSLRQITGADCRLAMTAARTIELRNYHSGMP